MGCQILRESDIITQDDFRVIREELEAAGMRYEYRMPKNIMTTGFIDVYYKKPHEFVDANGIRFCVGPYKRTMKDVGTKIGMFSITKDRRRETEDPKSTLPWLTHYCIDLRLYGYAWPYGRKEDILGTRPAGMHMIYEYAPDMESLRTVIHDQIFTIKNYIDNGKPLVKL